MERGAELGSNQLCTQACSLAGTGLFQDPLRAHAAQRDGVACAQAFLMGGGLSTEVQQVLPRPFLRGTPGLPRPLLEDQLPTQAGAGHRLSQG